MSKHFTHAIYLLICFHHMQAIWHIFLFIWGYRCEIMTVNNFVESNVPCIRKLHGMILHCIFQISPALLYASLISMLISPVPHIWDVTNGLLLPNATYSHSSPASLYFLSDTYMWRLISPYCYAYCVKNT